MKSFVVCCLLFLAVISSEHLLARARPLGFIGGDFSQGLGVYSPGFAAYTENGYPVGWSRNVFTPDMNGHFNDMAGVRNGVFAVGQFTLIGNDGPENPSWGVAFFDGTKWCAIRNGLSSGGAPGIGYAVWCNSDSSCYVMGEFDGLSNEVTGTDKIQRFTHYVWSNQTNEWVYDPSIAWWNNATANPLYQLPMFDGLSPLAGTLVGVPEDNPLYFFVGLGGGFPPMGELADVWRGGPGDGGWAPFTNLYRSFSDITLLSFSIDQSTQTMYIGGGSSPDTASAYISKPFLLRPCPASSPVCNATIGLAPAANWTHPAWTFASPIEEVGGMFVDPVFWGIVAAANNTQYFVHPWLRGGDRKNFDMTFTVWASYGGEPAVMLGGQFAPVWASMALPFDLFINTMGEVVAWGPFQGVNLYYPPNSDDNIYPVDVRSADTANWFAVYDPASNSWREAFGGGLDGAPMIARLNANTGQWFFYGEFTYVYDLHANAAAYYDDGGFTSYGQQPFFPVFTHAVQRRSEFPFMSPADVFAFACATQGCYNVYVGGDFQFIGQETFGAVVQVSLPASPSVNTQGDLSPVGGGLWTWAETQLPYNNDTLLQFIAGTVYTLATDGDYLYAGGIFNKGGNDYPCLRNIARINNGLSGESTTNWESLSGGCDGPVYDIQFYNGRLFAGGSFTTCGNRQVNSIAAYSYRDSAPQWSSLNGGVSPVGSTVYSLEVYAGRLIAGGQFSYAGGQPAASAAAWNDQYWRALWPACNPACDFGLPFYPLNGLDLSTVPKGPSGQIPLGVTSLRTLGDFLYAKVVIPDSESEGGTALLGRWQYTGDNDQGEWTFKGNEIGFSVELINQRLGNQIYATNGSLLGVVGTLTQTNEWSHKQHTVFSYDTDIENWVDNEVSFAENVWVMQASASSLFSPLSVLLRLFF